MPRPRSQVEREGDEMGCVYLARNLLNGKGYVGKTKVSMRRRMISHLEMALDGSKFLFHRALRKYELDVFEWKVLMRSDDPDDLNESEIAAIRALKTKYPDGYNMTDGGEGGDTFGVKSEEDMDRLKEKMRQARTPEIRKRVADFHRGRKRTLKTRLAISQATTGRTAWNKGKPDPSRQGKSPVCSFEGRKHTEESKQKMREARLGKLHSEETKRKISETKRKQALPSPMKGRKHTKEAIEKNRQAHLKVKHSSERV